MKKILFIAFALLFTLLSGFMETVGQMKTVYTVNPGNGHLVIVRTFTEAVHDTGTAYGDTIHLIAYSPPSVPTFCYESIRVFIRDSSNSKVDTFYIEYQTPTAGKWVRLGATNLLTQATDQVLVPGDGLLAGWTLKLPYGNTVRLRRVNTAYAGVHAKFWVSVETVSP